jgi:hypothetical protein
MDSKLQIIEEDKIISPPEYSETLKCMICFELCKDPSITSCCESLSCKQCIANWLLKSQTCPKCKAGKPTINLPNRFITRMFDNLKVKCNFHKNGCKNILSYFELKDHERNCEYNDSRYIKCQNCTWEISASHIRNHDCLKHLKQIISSLNISDLSSSRDSCYVKCPLEKKKFMEDIINNLKVHDHLLDKSQRTIFECDLCADKYQDTNSWNCKTCDFDMCLKCFDYCFNKDINNR